MSTRAEFMARLKALRQHPLVLQWIKDYQKDDKWRQYEDCRDCGYPLPHVEWQSIADYVARSFVHNGTSDIDG